MKILTITKGVILCKCACVLVRKYTDSMQTKTYKKYVWMHTLKILCSMIKDALILILHSILDMILDSIQAVFIKKIIY